MNGEQRTVAAFDFDGTLTRRDSLAPFLVRLLGRTHVAIAGALETPRLLLAAFGRDRDGAKARLLHRLLAGTDAERVRNVGREYGSHLARSAIRSDMRKRLESHRAEGHELVIVSASLDVYLREVARDLGVPTLLCTTMEVGNDGRLTGRMDGGNCRGPEKAARLRALLGDDSVTLWAYGDSAGDREMLAMATHAVRIGR